jgi:IS1 family transposase
VLDAETKLLVSLEVGPRTERLSRGLWEDFADRTDHVLPELITTDEYAPYRGAILSAYGERVEYPRTGRVGRPRLPRLEPPKELVYAMVHKTREKGAVVDVSIRRVFGTQRQLDEALGRSTVSSHVNTTFVERFNGTVRQHNSRKARKVYSFSKEFEYHVAMSWFGAAYYNFCRPHLGLREREDGRWSKRAPAMASGISDHVWSLEEFMSYPLTHKRFASSGEH